MLDSKLTFPLSWALSCHLDSNGSECTSNSSAHWLQFRPEKITPASNVQWKLWIFRVPKLSPYLCLSVPVFSPIFTFIFEAYFCRPFLAFLRKYKSKPIFGSYFWCFFWAYFLSPKWAKHIPNLGIKIRFQKHIDFENNSGLSVFSVFGHSLKAWRRSHIRL